MSKKRAATAIPEVSDDESKGSDDEVKQSQPKKAKTAASKKGKKNKSMTAGESFALQPVKHLRAMDVDQFQFFFKSKAKKPGHGAGEKLVSSPATYKKLAAIEVFRQMLSNFYVHKKPLVYKGYSYRTAEHLYHALKLRSIQGKRAIAATNKARQFTIESGSELSQQDALAAKRAGRQLFVMEEVDIFRWESGLVFEALETIWRVKFTQDEDCRRVLVATGDAQLWHVHRKLTQLWTTAPYALGDIRKELASAALS